MSISVLIEMGENGGATGERSAFQSMLAGVDLVDEIFDVLAVEIGREQVRVLLVFGLLGHGEELVVKVTEFTIGLGVAGEGGEGKVVVGCGHWQLCTMR